MTGRVMKPDEAERHGLVLRVTPPEELLREAFALAHTIAQGPPLAVREAKRLIDDGYQQALSAALTTEQGVLSRLFGTEDGTEGIAAFLEKRKPHFTGR